MRSDAGTVAQYLRELPDDRRKAIKTLRTVIRDNLNPGFKEGMQYGMIGYFVPHSVYPDGYHCDPNEPLPFAGLGSQKNHMALYLFCVYGNPTLESWFTKSWKATGKKLDMGKSCVRFKSIEDVPLDVAGALIARVTSDDFIARYEQATAGVRKPARKKATKKAGKTKSKKAASKKAAGRRIR
ncbi:MAG: DUF1801 domain-containing protein [Planctomycetota bacterium]